MNGNSGKFSFYTLRAAFAALALAAGTGVAMAQYGPPPRDLPPPDPGYGEYYHEQGPPNAAARWGFHAGIADGRHDRETGHSFRPTHDDGYKHVPDSNPWHVSRDEFKRIYREAYVHGYERGYGR